MNNSTHNFLSHKYSSGLSLVEILVTVVVLSIGLLGIAGMQAQGVRYSHDSYARSQATMLANELIERMHANPDAVANGDYETADEDVALNCSAVANDPAHATNTKPNCTGTDVCTVAELAQLDLFRVKCGEFLTSPGTLVGGVANSLPNGALAITCTNDASIVDTNPCTGDNSRTVTVTWQDPDQKETAATLQVQVNARFL